MAGIGGLGALGTIGSGFFQGYDAEMDALLKQQQLQQQQQANAAAWKALRGGFQPGGNTGFGPSAMGGGQGGPTGVPSGQGGIGSDYAASSPEGVVTRVESGDRNIPNTTQGTSSGQAQGYFQITTGTWHEFAPPEITARYPTPMSAPASVQAAVAGTIPLKRWAPSTVATVRKQFPWANPNMTLGQIQKTALAMQKGAGGQAMGMAAGGPGAAVAGAQPGANPNAPAPGAQPAQMSGPPGAMPGQQSAPTAALQRAQMGQPAFQPQAPPQQGQPQGGGAPQPGQQLDLQTVVQRLQAMRLPPAAAMAALKQVYPILNDESKMQMQQIMYGLRQQNQQLQGEKAEETARHHTADETLGQQKLEFAQQRFEKLQAQHEKDQESIDKRSNKKLDQTERLAMIGNKIKLEGRYLQTLNAQIQSAGPAGPDPTLKAQLQSEIETTQKSIKDLTEQMSQAQSTRTQSPAMGGNTSGTGTDKGAPSPPQGQPQPQGTAGTGMADPNIAKGKALIDGGVDRAEVIKRLKDAGYTDAQLRGL
jgi:hypothetical protein